MNKVSFAQLLLLTFALFPLWIVALQALMTMTSVSTAAASVLMDLVLS
jgi:hypothetical protein